MMDYRNTVKCSREKSATAHTKRGRKRERERERVAERSDCTLV